MHKTLRWHEVKDLPRQLRLLQPQLQHLPDTQQPFILRIGALHARHDPQVTAGVLTARGTTLGRRARTCRTSILREPLPARRATLELQFRLLHPAAPGLLAHLGHDVVRVVETHPTGSLAGVLIAQGVVLNPGEHRDDPPHGVDTTIHRGGVVALQQGADHELEHGDAVGDQLPHRLVAALQADIAGVLAARRDGDVTAAGELLVALEGTQRGLLTCFVAVEGVDNLAAEVAVVQHEAAQHRQVLGAESRATGGHSGIHSRGVHRHDIRIPLHHHGLVLLRDAALGLVDAEEHLGLLVQQGLRGVHVLAQLVVLEQLAGAEADDIACHRTDWPQQAAVETVDRPLGAHAGQAGGLELLELEALAQQVLGEGIPAGRGVAATELIGVLLGEATVDEELAGHVRTLDVRGELLPIELEGRLIRRDQALTSTGLLPSPRATALVVDAVADALGDLLHGLREGQMLHLHEEAEHVAALAGGEAVKVALIRADVEGGGLFILEGA